MTENNNKLNNAFLELKNISDYNYIMDSIVEEYSLDRDFCYVNYNLFLSLGLVDGPSVFEQNRSALLLFYFIIFVATIIILYNYLKKLLFNHTEPIKILHLLGIPEKMVMNCLLFILFLVVIMGIFCGVFFMFIGFIIVGYLMDNNLSKTILIFSQFDFLLLFKSLTLYLIFVIGFQLPHVLNFKRYISSNFSVIKRKNKNRLKTKHKFYTNTLANINIRNNSVLSGITVFSLAVVIVILVAGLYYFDENYRSQGYKTNMDYKITFEEDILGKKPNNLKEIVEKLSKFENECYIFPQFIAEERITLNKDILSDEFSSYLSEYSDYNLELNNKWNSNIKLPVVILGYSREQIKKLYSINGIKDDEDLAGNEVIALGSAISIVGEKGLDLLFNKNQEVHIESYNNGFIDKHIFKIKNIVSQLELLPDTGYNKICLVINEDMFKKMKNTSSPNSIFVKLKKDNENIKECIQKNITGYDNITIFFPKEIEQEIQRGNQFGMIVIVFLFVILLAVISITLYSTLYIRIHVNQERYSLLFTLGVSLQKQKRIFVNEMLKLFTLSIGISVGLSYFATYILRVNIYGVYGKYSYTFPIQYYVLSFIMTLFFMYVSLRLVYIKLRSTNTISILKERE